LVQSHFEDDKFSFNIEIEPEMIYAWVKEICEFRLNRYFARKAEKGRVNKGDFCVGNKNMNLHLSCGDIW